MPKALRLYLEDPFLAQLYGRIRAAGSLRSISIDLTNACNLRCTGCYYFSEGMDLTGGPPSDEEFHRFIQRELQRGTNFVTVVGGEPSLQPDRLRALHENFRINVATNGLIRIPTEGMESMPIGIAVWGAEDTDTRLRGGGKVAVFRTALDNYRNDPRAFWYYTVTPGQASEIEPVVERCVDNGNPVLFNFYSDMAGLGPAYDGRYGFDEALEAIDRVIARYPDRILLSRYLAKTVATGRLYGQSWGHEVCTSLSVGHPANEERLKNGNPYNPHFRAYHANLTDTRRCCTGVDRDCGNCFDVWEHFSWIILNMKKHLGSKEEFTNWLTSMYLFYLINRLVDYEEGLAWLPEIHRRVGVGTGQPVPDIGLQVPEYS